MKCANNGTSIFLNNSKKNRQEKVRFCNSMDIEFTYELPKSPIMSRQQLEVLAKDEVARQQLLKQQQPDHESSILNSEDKYSADSKQQSETNYFVKRKINTHADAVNGMAEYKELELNQWMRYRNQVIKDNLLKK
ncbi:Hypothetical_protein [Hexamita inflata]|uniref:Hypothetical_protein n=1 Tax=Hexamita inflata TaxID=28002 RepID=A0AA86PQP9_9EUKA|nr:Hypothetical protein HINF_LOCUS29303 [Hexamita inflata]